MDLWILISATVFSFGVGAFAWWYGDRDAAQFAEKIVDALGGRIKGGEAHVDHNGRLFRVMLATERAGEQSMREVIRIQLDLPCPASVTLAETQRALEVISRVTGINDMMTPLLQREIKGYRLLTASPEWASSWLSKTSAEDQLHRFSKLDTTLLELSPGGVDCRIRLDARHRDNPGPLVSQVLPALGELIDSATGHLPAFTEDTSTSEAYEDHLAPLMWPFLFFASATLACLPLIGWSASMPAIAIDETLELWSAGLFALLVFLMWKRRLRQDAVNYKMPRSLFIGANIFVITGAALWGGTAIRPLLQLVMN